jgi:hypothetical protein
MLTFINKSDVPNYSKGRSHGWAVNVLRDFIDSGREAATVSKDGSNVRSYYNSLIQANKRLSYPVIVTLRQEKVYLIRKDGE